MAWLAGSGNLKQSTLKTRVEHQSSSEEYEESDEEKKEEEDLEVFTVKKIVDHLKLNKGSVYKQTKHLHHTFDVAAMENSKFDYAFRVRWKNFKKEDDTWEPVENFNTAMEKKLRKYCKRKNIKVPDGFKDLLLVMSDPEEGTSGSDSDGESSRSTSVARSRSPSSAPQVDAKKEDEKRRTAMLQGDLTLSPSPSPEKPSREEKMEALDSLFDSTDDEGSSKKKDGKKAPMKKFANLKDSPKQEKKKKNERDGSIDREEKRLKEQKRLKKWEKEEREKVNSFVADDSELKKEEEEKRRKKERADLEKKAAEHMKALEEEQKRKKEKKQAKIAKEKAESEKPKKGLFTPPEKHNGEMLSSSDERKRMDRGAQRTPESPMSPMAAGSCETPKSHYDLEMKKRKKKLEEKRKEREREKGLEKNHNGDDHKKADERREERREKEREEERWTMDVVQEVKKPCSTSRNHYRIPKRNAAGASPRKEGGGEEKRRVYKPSSLANLTKFARARIRMDAINMRFFDFEEAAAARELQREQEWEEEEDRWRKGMYEQQRWSKIDAIKDQPFDLRAEQRETDVKHVRTLRRCWSLERLPHSFRRLSSLRSMDSLTSEADSVAAALMDLRVGMEKDRHNQLRMRTAERERIEAEMKKLEAIVPGSKDVYGRGELFIRETIAMTNEHMPGAATEQFIEAMCMQAMGSFLSLSPNTLVSILSSLNLSRCINETILRLVRIFTPVINLATMDEGCWRACDEGEHRKCRMLLALLMTLSEPHRMGEGEDCLLPPNALYEAIGVSAPCQIRAMIRGGCPFDWYYDEEGKNAAHRMQERCSLTKLIWLIERGLDVNSAINPQREADLASDLYDKPWKIVKEANEKAAFLSQLHSQRLTARSVAWTKGVEAVAAFNLRPLTLVHTLNPHAYFHRLAAVTLCNVERKGYDPSDAVLLAIHSATVRQGRGLRATHRKNKKHAPALCIPYFLIDQSTEDPTLEYMETYLCIRARLTIHNLDRPSASDTVELERLGTNGPTTVFKVPRKQAQYLISGRRFTESLLKIQSPPEHSLILAQFLIAPFRQSSGKFTDQS